jgi:uncharacterized HAD superfamily protein
MTRITIAIDVDDVISSQVKPLMDFVNNNYDANLTDEDFQQPGEYWGYYRMVLADNPEEAQRRFEHYLKEHGPVKQLIDEDAAKALPILKENYDLHIVTSRGQDFTENTIEWLSKELPDIFKGIHFVHLWDKEDVKATKAMVCADIGAGYLIDDNAIHCNLAAEAGVTSILFGKYGWNLGVEIHPEIIQMNSWKEILGYFDDKFRK